GTPWLATHGWTRAADITLWDCIDAYRPHGVQHVLCTDVSRDGAMTGPATELYRDFVQRCPGIALQASGGVRNIDDLETLRAAGAAAAITGRALLDGAIPATEIRTFLRGA
ncbi:MAG: HisA/HisF-related TIM barrel protein, partial [Woeseia sp.]